MRSRNLPPVIARRSVHTGGVHAGSCAISSDAGRIRSTPPSMLTERLAAARAGVINSAIASFAPHACWFTVPEPDGRSSFRSELQFSPPCISLGCTWGLCEGPAFHATWRLIVFISLRVLAEISRPQSPKASSSWEIPGCATRRYTSPSVRSLCARGVCSKQSRSDR